MTGTQRRLTGRIQVALPPGEAFRLFTPRGEEEWVHGWQPRFPAHAYLQSWQDAITAWLHNALAAGGAVGAKQRPVLRTGFWVLFVDGLNAGDDRSTATAQADFLQIGLADTRSCGCRARDYEVVQCLRCGQLGQLPRYLLPYPGQVDAEDPLPASERVYDLVG